MSRYEVNLTTNAGKGWLTWQSGADEPEQKNTDTVQQQINASIQPIQEQVSSLQEQMQSSNKTLQDISNTMQNIAQRAAPTLPSTPFSFEPDAIKEEALKRVLEITQQHHTAVLEHLEQSTQVKNKIKQMQAYLQKEEKRFQEQIDKTGLDHKLLYKERMHALDDLLQKKEKEIQFEMERDKQLEKDSLQQIRVAEAANGTENTEMFYDAQDQPTQEEYTARMLSSACVAWRLTRTRGSYACACNVATSPVKNSDHCCTRCVMSVGMQ